MLPDYLANPIVVFALGYVIGFILHRIFWRDE